MNSTLGMMLSRRARLSWRVFSIRKKGKGEDCSIHFSPRYTASNLETLSVAEQTLKRCLMSEALQILRAIANIEAGYVVY